MASVFLLSDDVKPRIFKSRQLEQSHGGKVKSESKGQQSQLKFDHKADSKPSKQQAETSGRVERRRCRLCDEVGHLWRNCSQRVVNKKDSILIVADAEEDDEEEIYTHSFESSVLMIKAEDRFFFRY